MQMEEARTNCQDSQSGIESLKTKYRNFGDIWIGGPKTVSNKMRNMSEELLRCQQQCFQKKLTHDCARKSIKGFAYVTRLVRLILRGKLEGLILRQNTLGGACGDAFLRCHDRYCC